MQRKNVGFSLIECLIALGIVGLILAGALPQLSAWRDSRLLRAEADKIRLTLEHAATLAIASLRTVEVSLNKNSATVRYQDGSTILVHHRPPSLFLAPQGSNRDVLVFYPTITATPATLSLKSRTLTCSIIVSLRTRVTARC
jgi:prepilin-type N-terminal cleavage/methylation domain-containing protein